MPVPRRSSAGRRGVRLHQFLSFSPLFQQVAGQGGEMAFFPGCSMAGHDAALVRRAYEWLLAADPRMGLVSACCGHPTLCLGDAARFLRYQERLAGALASAGIKKLAVCCPNCAGTLENLPGVEVVSVWRLLDRLKAVFPVKSDGVRWALHDPCPTRDDPETQEAFRRVMARNGVRWEEYRSNRERALCCGKKKMLMVLDPESGRKILARRLSERANRNVLTYCFSCVQSFAAAGCRSVHGLELLFGSSGSCGRKRSVWGKRLETSILTLKMRRGRKVR